jgi:hypothetical protein
MSKVMLYERLSDGKHFELIKYGEHYVSICNKYVHPKELKILYKFIGYVHRINNYNPSDAYTYTNVNHFKVRVYKK